MNERRHSMTRKLGTLLITPIFLVSLITPIAPSNQVYAAGVSVKAVTTISKYYVTATSLNIRKEPATTSARVTSVKKNEAVTLYEKKGSWARVKTVSGKTGWASIQYLATKAPATPIASAPKSLVETAVKYYVTATSLNIRKEPKITAASITSVKKNEIVNLYEKKGPWGRVKTASGKTGWASLSYLTTKAPAISAPGIPTPIIYYVNATSLNVRTGPSTLSSIATSVKKNEVVSLYEKKGTWARIKTASGKTGWVSLSFLSTKAPGNPTPVVSPEPPAAAGVKGKLIVLDPGHGGTDVGAIGKVQNERNLTLQTATEVKVLLEKAGAKVIMTRTSNTSRKLELSERVAISHQYNAQTFVSIHYNSGSTEATGIETYFYPTYSDEAKLASAIQQELIKQTQMQDRKVKNTSAFYVIKNNRMPSILAELGFISNPVEEKRIITKEYQQQAARGIFNGLNKYFSQ
jgi:N-acetylmuramoyl-L-alanine amidase